MLIQRKSLRDTKSGMMFLCYSNEYSEYYSTLLAESYLEHLEKFGIPLTEVTIQTDNGSEFGARKRDITTPGFVNSIEHLFSAKHNYIPPGMCNANGDVESVHSTIELEFFDLETFESREDFFRKVQAYQYFYNITRPNFSKKAKTPLQILEEDRPETHPKATLFPVLDLDKLFKLKYNLGGQPLHKLPVNII